MIGLGTWKFDVDLPFIHITPTVTISPGSMPAGSKGKYQIEFELGGVNAAPSWKILKIKEKGSQLIIKVALPKGKLANSVEVVLDFTGSFCEGTVYIPVLGRIRVKGTLEEERGILDERGV